MGAHMKFWQIIVGFVTETLIVSLVGNSDKLLAIHQTFVLVQYNYGGDSIMRLCTFALNLLYAVKCARIVFWYLI